MGKLRIYADIVAIHYFILLAQDNTVEGAFLH
jgi:hypothetical protein